MTTSRRLFLAKLGGLAGFSLLAKAKPITEPLSLPVVVPRMSPWSPLPDKTKGYVYLDHDRLLFCISEVETGHKDDAVGPCGARSRYQISEAVWKQHVKKDAGHTAALTWHNFDGSLGSHISSCQGSFAREIALRHLGWLDKNIPHDPRLTPDLFYREYALAFAWKEGLSSWNEFWSVPHSRTTRGDFYATRVTNLYYDPTYKVT
jgi:hypothetical protein